MEKSVRCVYYKVGVGVLTTVLAAVTTALTIHLYITSNRVGDSFTKLSV
jgi:hypothetical protein